MLTTLFPGLRSLRVALLTGVLLLGSLYVLLAGNAADELRLRAAAQDILELAGPVGPIALALVACYLVGSIYMTGLETAIDWIHRRTIFTSSTTLLTAPKSWLIHSLEPLSKPALDRLRAEAARFHEVVIAHGTQPLPSSISDKMATDMEVERQKFVEQVCREALWLEGKLAGTPLAAPYDQMRSEGEMRVGTAPLLPLAGCAVAFAVRLSPAEGFIWIVPVFLISLKLADYGLYHFRKAHSFVAHHIADGTTLTGSMETLRRQRGLPLE